MARLAALALGVPQAHAVHLRDETPSGELHGTRTVLPSGVQFVYQLPQTPTGLLLLAHGCGRSAENFWPPGTGCPKCRGLPVETGFVASALADAWAVLAVNSEDRWSKCWHADVHWPVAADVSLTEDVQRIHSAIRYVQGLLAAPVPVAALGVSTGGRVVEQLAQQGPSLEPPLHLIADVVQVMSSPLLVQGRDHVPVRFMYMPRDLKYAGAVRDQVTALRALDVDADAIQVNSTPLTTASFASRHGGVVAADPRTAATVVAALRKADVLDPAGFVRLDPAMEPGNFAWRHALRDLVSLPDQDPISEVMSHAFGLHEATDTDLGSVMAWLDEKRKENRANGRR